LKEDLIQILKCIKCNFGNKEGYKVKGCLDYTTRNQLKYQKIGDIYDFLFYHIPYLAGTIIGFKSMKNKQIN
jgi:predicted RNA-binding protein with PUA-like domain